MRVSFGTKESFGGESYLFFHTLEYQGFPEDEIRKFWPAL